MPLILYLISAFTGALTILLSLILLYKKRITLDQVVKSDLPGEAIKAQILNFIKISSREKPPEKYPLARGSIWRSDQYPIVKNRKEKPLTSYTLISPHNLDL